MPSLLTKIDWPFGIISDIHCRIPQLEAILARHSDIPRWVCLGDIVDFQYPKHNRETMDWWTKHGTNILTVYGNHEEKVVKELLNISFTHQALIRKFYTGLDLILPDGSHLLCHHSIPGDNWSFVEETCTEREFVDNYPAIGDHVKAVCIGHNHKQFVGSYPYLTTELWSVGAVTEGRYAVITERGLQLQHL